MSKYSKELIEFVKNHKYEFLRSFEPGEYEYIDNISWADFAEAAENEDIVDICSTICCDGWDYDEDIRDLKKMILDILKPVDVTGLTKEDFL